MGSQYKIKCKEENGSQCEQFSRITDEIMQMWYKTLEAGCMCVACLEATCWVKSSVCISEVLAFVAARMQEEANEQLTVRDTVCGILIYMIK